MSVLPSLIKQAHKETLYRVYVTDALKVICENTAKQVGGGYLTERYYDVEKAVDRPVRSSPPKSANRILEKLRGGAIE